MYDYYNQMAKPSFPPYQTKSESSHTSATACRVCQIIKSKPNQLILHFTSRKNPKPLCLTTVRYKSHDHKNVILKKQHMDPTAHCTAVTQKWWLADLCRDWSRFNFSFFCRPSVKLLSYFETKDSSDGVWSHLIVSRKVWAEFVRTQTGKMPLDCETGKMLLDCDTGGQLTPAIMVAICQLPQSSQCPIRSKLTFLFSFDHFCRVQMFSTPGQHLTPMTWQFVQAGH